MRVLCTGDIHLGRRSTRLPANLDQRKLSCAAAWDEIVEYAIGQQVDAVALSGDLIDQENRYYESLGPLERGLRRLADAGIPAVAVAGNHDFGVLPELARVLPDGCLKLLGLGGSWERATLTARNGAKLYVDGWSFPTQHVRENPLHSYNLPFAADAPVLGLLHADLDTPGGTYAPVSLTDLQARPVALWLLGHIHAPRAIEIAGKPTILYPGSPQPMDPGEGGEHGVWLADLNTDSPVTLRRVPVATVRYDLLDVDVSGALDIAAARDTVLASTRQRADEIALGAGPLCHVSLRIRITGRFGLRRELEAEMCRMCADLEYNAGNATVYVERADVNTRPDRDLDHLARGADAVSFLARLILDLDGASVTEGSTGSEVKGYEDLFHALGPIPESLRVAKPYKALSFDSAEFDSSALRKELANQANALLDELLAQKEQAA